VHCRDARGFSLIDQLTVLPDARASQASGMAGDPATALAALGKLLLETAADRFALLAVYIADGLAQPTVAGEMLQHSARPRPTPNSPRCSTIGGAMLVGVGGCGR
jgi:hypothetical protein